MKLISAFFVILLIISISLSAQTENPERKEFLKIKYDQTFLSISPLLSPRICFGLVKTDKQDDDRYLEAIWYVHAFETFSNYRAYGAAFRGNAFIAKNKRSGIYLLANCGLDYVKSSSICFAVDSNANCPDINRIYPNLALGFGYSLKIKNDAYLRLEWDLGYKWFVSNLYISYIW